MLRRKTLAFLLSAAMIAGLVPATVMAEETEELSLPEETVEAAEAVDEEAPEESLEPEEVIIQADSEEYADPDTVNTGMTFENGVLTLAGTVNRRTLNDFLTSHGLDDMLGVYKVTCAEGTELSDMSNLFQNFYDVTEIDLTNASASGYYNMDYAFEECRQLESVIFGSNINTQSVTNVEKMFNGCSSLKKIIVGTGWDLSSVDYSSDMFKGCTSLTGPMGTAYAASFTDMTYARIDFGDVNRGYLTPDHVVFDGTTKVMLLAGEVCRNDIYDAVNYTGDVEKIFAVEGTKFKNDYVQGNLFQGLQSVTSIDLKNADTSEMTSMSSMFCNCTSLEVVDLSGFDTSNVTDMSNMFRYCSSLEVLDLSAFDTSNVTDMDTMFGDCSSLTTIYVSNGWDVSGVESDGGMFEGCNVLIGEFGNQCGGSGGVEHAGIPLSREDNSYMSLKGNSIAGYSVTLDDMIGINVYVKTDNPYSCVFTWGTGDYQQSCWPEPSIDNNISKFVCPISARSMTDTITLNVMDGDDVIITDTFRLVDYVNAVARQHSNTNIASNVSLHKLLKSMLNYGGEVQKYFNYRTDDLASDYIDNTIIYDGDTIGLGTIAGAAEHFKESAGAIITGYEQRDDTINNISPDTGLEFYGASFICSDRTYIRFYFRVIDQTKRDELENMSITFNGEDCYRDFTQPSGEYMYFDTSSFAPADLKCKDPRDSYMLLQMGDTTYRYSLLYYMARCIVTDNGFGNAAVALAVYSKFAGIYNEYSH